MSGYYEMINTSLDDGLLCLCLGWPGNISPVSLQTRRVTMTPVLLGVSAVTGPGTNSHGDNSWKRVKIRHIPATLISIRGLRGEECPDKYVVCFSTWPSRRRPCAT